MDKYRQGGFFVVYAREQGNIEYLLLKRKLHWKGWEFPKGGLLANEKIEETIKRELKEETGLHPTKITKFPFKGEYEYEKPLKDRKKFTGQTFSLFGVLVKKGNVKIDNTEHSDYKWLNLDNIDEAKQGITSFFHEELDLHFKNK